MKGREKFFNQKSVNSYVGCAYCAVKFPKGCRGPIFGVARRYLCPGHRLRRHIATPYEYLSPEPALPPPIKDTAFIKYTSKQAELHDLDHYLGQKGEPMFADLENFNYELMNPPDWTHNLARLFVWICKVLVGPNGEGHASDTAKVSCSDNLHRVQAQKHGIFPDIWPDRPIYLDADVANMLHGVYMFTHTTRCTHIDHEIFTYNNHSTNISAESIEGGTSQWCKEWWKTCRKKVPQGTRVATLRAQILEWQQVLKDTGRLQIDTGTGTLPWRLSPEAVKVVDARIESIVYPHGPAGCSKDGAGFIKNMNRVRRISQKLLAFLVILPTVLRDYVPELRTGLRKLVLGLKILEGRCVNAKEAMELDVAIGSRPLLEEDIDKARTLIIEGLSMLEGISMHAKKIACMIASIYLLTRPITSFIIHRYNSNRHGTSSWSPICALP